MNTKDRIEHIRKLIYKDELEAAIAEMEILVNDDDLLKYAPVLNYMRIRLNESKHLSKINPEEAIIVHDKVLSRLFDLLFKIEYLANSKSKEYGSPDVDCVESAPDEDLPNFACSESEWYENIENFSDPFETPLEYPEIHEEPLDYVAEPDIDYANKSENFKTSYKSKIDQSAFNSVIGAVITTLSSENLNNQNLEHIHENQLGKLLYQVPNTMPLNCSSKCLIRVAIDAKSIRKGIFSGIKARIKNQIAVSERMSAELIDPSGKVFSIQPLNAKEQKILSKGFTEWIFHVIPQMIGIHELLVKVSLLEFDQNVKEYLPRDISMLESVTIIAVDQQNGQVPINDQNSLKILDILSKPEPSERQAKRIYPSKEASEIPASYSMPNTIKGEMTNPLPETPSSLIGYILNLFPKPLNVIVALCLLGGAAYVAYHYFMPKKNDKIEKVYVSGRLYIDNGTPRINEVTRLVLRNIPGVNSTRLDATGKYTFKNVPIPENKKLLVDITFENGETVPTEELSVGKVDPNDNTLYLDDINASRPKPAKSGKPATGWSIKIVNQNNLNGDNNANQK